MRLAFANCVFDSDTREVLRGGVSVGISPKAFELLELLIRNRPKAVSKEQIHEHLWPKVFVSDASLTNLVAELRAALGDSAQSSRIFGTVRRFGYRFVAEERREGPVPPLGAAYRLIWEKREIDLHPGENIFGRDHEAVVWIDDPAVSRHHARIVISPAGATIEDLGSKNGTRVDGEIVDGAAKLSDGAEIQIGQAAMTFHVLRQTGTTQTASGLKRSSRSRKA
jgi:DNA-binding winged helix-turn-helix (wHTH) protein